MVFVGHPHGQTYHHGGVIATLVPPRGELPVIAGTAVVGSAAVAAGRKMLLDAEVIKIADQHGVTKSLVIPEAVEAYVRARA